MPIHRVAAASYAARLIHQGLRHGYTSGVPNTAGYGGGLQASRIAQPKAILIAKKTSSSRFPDPWTLEVTPPPEEVVQTVYFGFVGL